MWACHKHEWALCIDRFCRAVVLTQHELVSFHAKQLWIEQAINTLDLQGVTEEPLRDATRPPCALMYGSVVAGTAFTGGDVDYAVAFRRVKSSSSSPFVDVHRSRQAVVLARLYEMFAAKQGNDKSDLNFQRIFHARVPIVQCGVVELKPLRPAQDSPPLTAEKAAGPDQRSLLRWAAPESRIARYLRPGGRSPLYSFHSVFDVSASLTGCRNSLLLRHYSTQWPVIRRLAMVLKFWGRKGGPAAILSARSGWLSPYALHVMLVYFLSERGLIQLAPTSIVEDALESLVVNPLSTVITSHEWDAEQLQRTVESPLAIPLGDEPLTEFSGVSLAEILRGFFDFYATFDFDEHVIDIRADGATDKVKTKAEWKDYVRAQVVATEIKCPGDLKAQEEELGVPPVQRSGENMQGRPLMERCLWHRLGYEAMMIRDPIESHSLGRGVDFFRAEAIRDVFARVAKDPSVNPATILKLPGVESLVAVPSPI